MNVLVLARSQSQLARRARAEIYRQGYLADANRGYSRRASPEVKVKIFQKSGEGELIDLLHKYRKMGGRRRVQSGRYTHYSYALRDAVAAISKPTVRGSSQRYQEARRNGGASR